MAAILNNVKSLTTSEKCERCSFRNGGVDAIPRSLTMSHER